MTTAQAKNLEQKIGRLEKLIFLHIQRSADDLILTPDQKKDLLRARKNLSRGKTLSLNELKQKLGFTS